MAETCGWLVLVPTEIESGFLRIEPGEDVRVELCGFGPIVAAVRAASLIEKLQPKNVLLCGIAGSYSKKLPIGSAFQFSRVACYGVGVGSGAAFKTTSEIGWKQWNADESSAVDVNFSLELKKAVSAEITSNLLVSVCAAAIGKDDVQNVKSKFPEACAEDMEGFSVATAAGLAKVPCYVVRGISNFAGDRNHENWQIAEAMSSVAAIANQILNEKR